MFYFTKCLKTASRIASGATNYMRNNPAITLLVLTLAVTAAAEATQDTAMDGNCFLLQAYQTYCSLLGGNTDPNFCQAAQEIAQSMSQTELAECLAQEIPLNFNC